MKNKKISNKKIYKLSAKECKICGENDYCLLNVHRIIAGEHGGKYTVYNSICLCVRCHTLVHDGQIKIIGIFDSTAGKLLHYFDQSGKEIFKEL
jgi:hypothetical protein